MPNQSKDKALKEAQKRQKSTNKDLDKASKASAAAAARATRAANDRTQLLLGKPCARQLEGCSASVPTA